MTITLIILIITVAMFIWGRVRADIVALSALAALLFLGILTPAEALAGFSSPIVIMMIGLFVVGGAIMQTGLAKLTGNKLMALSRGNETVTFLLVMLVTSFIGAFVSNTGTVALMMPIIMSLAAGSGMQSSRFLMPLAFAGSLGGMLTLIGTPPNLVIDEVLTEAGFKPLAFFSFFPVGIIVIAIGIIVLMPLSKIFLSKKQNGKKKKNGKSLDDLVDEYQLLDNLHRYIVPSKRTAAAIDENGQMMDIVGKTLKDLSIQKKYGVSIIEIRNEKKSRLGLVKDVNQNMAKSILSIGAVRGFEIGDGFSVSESNGSTNNDPFRYDENGALTKLTNHAGGTLGGMSDGSRILFRAAVKPTPSISREQQSGNKDGENVSLSITGRHDPVIVPRAVVVVEAMAAITIVDLLFTNMCARMDKISEFYQR